MVNLLAIESQTIIMLVLLAVMVVVLIVLPMFTNRRRNKAINDLHSSLRPGDVIKTVGGIVGTIIEIKEISPVDKEMVVETGIEGNKSVMVFDVQAVYQVISKTAEPTPEPVAEPTAIETPSETSAETPVESPVDNAAQALAEEVELSGADENLWNSETEAKPEEENK